MTPFLIYLLKVSAVIAVLYLVYYLLLRRSTFHVLNRICLMAIVVFAFAVPLITIDADFEGAIPVIEQMKEKYSVEFTDYESEAENGLTDGATRSFPFLSVIYAAGVAWFMFRFLRSVLELTQLRRKSTTDELNGVPVRRTNVKTSFTFFNTIFIPHSENDTMIARHEHAHVTQRHWIDLVLLELASIVLWFNPVMLFLKREVRLRHEFLADIAVLKNGVSFEDYAHCLVSNIMPTNVSVHTISPLKSNSTKERIIMMTKQRSPRYMFFLYLLFIPAFGVTLMGFGRKIAAPFEPVRNIGVQAYTMEEGPRIAPVDLQKVTKIVKYGDRIHPATKMLAKHTGVDFALPPGSDVVATADGVVVVQEFGELRGNYVVIRHDQGYRTRYFHLEKALVKNGDVVKEGQVIGLVGSTGKYSTGPHLHYEVVKNGEEVDPKDYLPKLAGLSE